jgi:methylmalonyl-CoA epimerase
MGKVDHIGIVVKSIKDALKLYTGLLGIDPLEEEVIETRGIKVCLLEVGNTKIELLQPIREDSEISSYLAKKGEGMHHIAYEVEDVSKAIIKAKEIGLKALADEPKPGAHNTMVVFLHPKTVNGVLTELLQY